MISVVLVAFTIPVNELRGYEDDSVVRANGSFHAIIDSWRHRQAKIKSVVVRWTEKRIVAKGGTLAKGAIDGQPEQEVPPHDVKFDATWLVRLEGEKVYCEITDEGWYWKDNRMHPREYVSAYDGKQSSLVWRRSETGYPSASVNRRETTASEARTVYMLPIRASLCTLQPPPLGFGPDSIRDGNRRGQVAGRSCHVLEVWRDGRRRELLWVDESAPYALRRVQQMARAGYVRVQCDLNQESSDQFGWLPSGWTLTVLGDERNVRQTVIATVDGIEMNIPLPSDAFEAQPPTAAWVNDHKSGEEYILREDGSKRMIHQSELRRTYDELLNSEPGVGPTWQRWAMAVSLFIVLTLAGAALLVFLRRRWTRQLN